MIRFLFGVLLGLLVAFPTFLEFVLDIVAAVVSQPAVLAFAAGVVLWPRLVRTVRGWTS